MNYSSNIGQLFCCDRDGVILFVAERYYVGVEQLYHELSKRDYASLPQPYPSEEMKKNKRFQYMKKISSSIMGFWLFLLFGLSSLLFGGLIHAQAHFTSFENYEVSGIIENYSLNNGALKIDLVGDDKTYYVNKIVYEKLDKDVYYVLAKNEEIKLYIAYQDEYERYHISQIELQHVIYLDMEEAESALYSNYKTSKIVSYVFLGIGTVLEILALVDIIKIKILKNQPCSEP